MAATYEPIASTTLGSDTASITFSGIPQTYRDLVVSAFYAQTVSAAMDCQINSTTTTCSYTYLLGNGSAASSGRATSQAKMRVAYMNSGNTWGDFQVQFMSYASSSVYKTALVSWGSNAATFLPNLGKIVNLSQTLSPITSLVFQPNSGSLKAGTVISLYGIKAA